MNLKTMEVSRIEAIATKTDEIHTPALKPDQISVTRAGITIHYPMEKHDRDALEYKVFNLSGTLLYSQKLTPHTNTSEYYTVKKLETLKGAVVNCVYKNGMLVLSSRNIIQ